MYILENLKIIKYNTLLKWSFDVSKSQIYTQCPPQGLT